MVSDASKKKAAQKKAAAAAKRGGKAAAASSKAADKVADKISDIKISDRTCTGVLCSHPLSRDIRVSNYRLIIIILFIIFTLKWRIRIYLSMLFKSQVNGDYGLD